MTPFETSPTPKQPTMVIGISKGGKIGPLNVRREDTTGEIPFGKLIEELQDHPEHLAMVLEMMTIEEIGAWLQSLPNDQTSQEPPTP